jgi:hypothetical protein
MRSSQYSVELAEDYAVGSTSKKQKLMERLLRVLWLEFDGHAAHNKVVLKWTFEAYDNLKFSIERSVKGTDFVSIASVGSKGGWYEPLYAPRSFVYYRQKLSPNKAD